MRVIKNQRMSLPWKSRVLILLLTALFVVYLLLKPGNPASMTLVDNVIQGVLEGVGLLLTFPYFLQSSHQRERVPASARPRPASSPTTQRWVPPLLGLGILCYIIGQALWTYNEDIAHLAVLFPSWADAGYLGSYPFVLLAILLLPPAATRARIALDGLMIMVGTVTFSWYFILGPTILQGTDSTILGKIIGTAYPLVALMLIFCLLLLLAYTHDHEIRPVVLILSLALIVIVTTNSIYDFQELHDLYSTGTLLDVGWPLGYMLVGLGARTLHLHLAAKNPTHSYALVASQSRHLEDPLLLRRSLWRSLLPYFSVPAVVLLLVYTRYFAGNSSLEGGVYLGATILMVLLLLRQILTIRGMISDNEVLWLMQQEVNTKSNALFQANSQLKEQSRQMERAYEQQRQLNELKDQFLLNVSHELRTPLTMLGGSLELLDEHGEHLDPMEWAQMLKDARAGQEELVDLVNRVLDATTVMGEIPGSQPEGVHIHQLVQEVLASLSPLQAYTIRLQIPEQIVAWADPQLLSLVLRNLLTNILKYVPTQTEITISATQLTPSSPVSLAVQDAGPGIPPEELPLLFEKFVRLKRDLAGATRGTGLGLYICKRLVKEMGGQIWVESSGHMGEGSRFCLTLPPYPFL
jgi:signal transduction histidine kinase